MISTRTITDGFEVQFNGKVVIRHSADSPFLFAGQGQETIDMYRGNFEIEDRIIRRVPLTQWEISKEFGQATTPETEGAADLVVRFYSCDHAGIECSIREEQGRCVLSFSDDSGISDHPDHPAGEVKSRETDNRFWFRFPALADEKVYGAGEQFSYLNLRGRRFPLWTSEQGVGRNKSTPITFQADVQDRCGGDYWWTFFPQPTFVSSERYYLHVDSRSYAAFDFRDPEFHELEFWELPESMTVFHGPTMAETVQDVSALLGRQPELPDWVHDGVILGIQGGTQVCQEKTQAALDAKVPVAGIWAQDWEGIRMTSFGQRLMWNWQWDENRYPGLPETMQQWKQQGIRFLGYANPYLAVDTPLFKEAQAQGLLAKNEQGTDYLVDFGEFDAGMPDFTNPLAYEWYKGVLKKHLVDFGLGGWMADFGEYLPHDTVLFDGTPGMLAHNPWPALWARLNREVIDEAGVTDQVTFFMRAGYTGSQRWCPLMWAGDQNVDWSEDDGLLSVIPAALSLAVCGHGLHHSDIGGYTTLYGMKRTKELFMRWAEFAAFTPVMRGHEGNRPKDNWQFDSDRETLEHLARMAGVFKALKPYRKNAVRENAQQGLPVMRPMFLHYEQDEPSWTIKDQYLLGRDVLVAPIVSEGWQSRMVHLPREAEAAEGILDPGKSAPSANLGGETKPWIHLWTGKAYGAGDWEIQALLGQPPVFYRAGSSWKSCFEQAVKG